MQRNAYYRGRKRTEEHEMGHVFSFSDPSVDEYCYCVEENEFGLTYHRFSREDYEAL